MSPLLTLRVPATSANLGSGFDSLGMALSLHNVFTVTAVLPPGEYKIDARGEGSAELSRPENNLIVTASKTACERWGVAAPGFALECENVIPLCRGLGSSSTAVVAGVIIADALTGRAAGADELLRTMTAIEGHPDNVAPCFLGGMTVNCWDGETLRTVPLPPLPPEIRCVAAVPDVRVKTADARAALPKEIPFGDAVFNVSRAALLAAAWATGAWDQLKCAMTDRLHQPYRGKLFPGGETVVPAAAALPECVGSAISGSGPTILALVRGDTARTVETMNAAFAESGVNSRCFVLTNCAEGAGVEFGAGLAAAREKYFPGAEPMNPEK